MSSISDGVALALADAFSATSTTFVWQGQSFGCVINADQNVLVTSKMLLPNIPFCGDIIQVAGKRCQVVSIANSTDQFVSGGITSDNLFINDPNNPSIAIQFNSFIGQ